LEGFLRSDPGIALAVADSAEHEVDRMRASFFDKTGRVIFILYGGLALGAAGAAAIAFVLDVRRAVVGLAIGFVVMVVLLDLSTRVSPSSRWAKVLMAVSVAFGLLFPFASLNGHAPPGLQALALGAGAGGLAGAIVGIAAIRHRLARDDELLMRQQRLGFDPEHPWAWLRPKGGQ
jgi:hypothetical protein